MLCAHPCCSPRQQPAEVGPESAPQRAVRARGVYERAYRSLRESQPDAKEEAVMLLEAWRSFEAGCSAFRYGQLGHVQQAVTGCQ